MKYSFMSFSCPELTLDEMLEAARRFGYHGIEPRLVSGHRHRIETDTGAAQRAEIRRKVADSGVALACIATSCRYADPSAAQQQVDETRRCIDLAAEVGAPRLRVFGGSIPEDVDRDVAIKLVADSLASVGTHAQERGVTLCLETHDAWCDPAQVAAVMQRANHSAVAVNWDVMHPVRVAGATMEGAFRTLQRWIRHVHVHDAYADGRLAPIGSGDYDHRTVISLLKTAHYDGYLSGEWINWEDGWESHLPRELRTMRQYETEV